MKVLIIGGTGVIGRCIVEELLLEDNDVTTVNRGTSSPSFSSEVEQHRLDRTDTKAFETFLHNRIFDAVIDVVCFNERDAAQSVALFRNRTGHLVVISSVAVYQRPLLSVPTREDAESLWDDPAFPYAYEKARMENKLVSMMGRSTAGITIVRPSLTFGEGSRNVGVLRQNAGIITRIRQRKPLLMFGDGTSPWCFSFAPDVARGIVGLLGKAAAKGEAFHVSCETPTEWLQLYLEFGRLVGVEPRIVFVPATTLRRALPDLCAHLDYEKSHPGVFDNGKLRGVIPDFRARISLTDGLRMLIQSWERDHLVTDAAKDTLEDRLVKAAEQASRQVVRAATQSG